MASTGRRQAAFLLLTALVLVGFTATAGCLDDSSPIAPFSDADQVEEEPVEQNATLGPFEREPGERLLADATYQAPFFSLGPMEDGVWELPRTENVIANGTERLVIEADYDPQLQDLRVGYQLDDGPITWEDPDPQETLEVDVAPEETEANGTSWTFYADEGDPPPARSGLVEPSWSVTVHAQGSYPVQEEPVKAEDWDRFRSLVLEGLDVQPPTIRDVPNRTNRDRPVVAIVDSGINPLHEAFQDDQLEAAGSLSVPAFNQTTGEPAQYVDIDPQDHGQAWTHTALEGRTLYRFSSTPHYFYSTTDSVPRFDMSGHGTGVAASVLGEDPDAAIVNVQTPLGWTHEGIQWAAEQDWIDVIVVSRGCPNDCVDWYPEYRAGLSSSSLPEATQDAWESGKLVVYAAGNSPSVTGTDPNDGPPWVISVGGADTERQGEAWTASKAPDVVSDMRVEVPRHDAPEGTWETGGTSYAAPIVAGTLSEAIGQLRDEVGHEATPEALVAGEATFTNEDLREALNRSATYWDTTDYDPTARQPDLLDVAGAMGIPINPAAPWLQMGWGYANASIVDTMTQGMLEEDLPDKPEGAQAFMEQRQSARQEAWR